MTKKIEEPNEYISIVGFRNVQIKNINTFLEQFNNGFFRSQGADIRTHPAV